MKEEIKIEGMSCMHCVSAVEKELKKIAGLVVEKVEIGKAIVKTESESMNREEIYSAIREAGYSPVK